MKHFNYKALLFALLSVTDSVLTWWLLERSGRGAFEANPIADWLLNRFVVKRSDASVSKILLLEEEYNGLYFGNPMPGQSVAVPGRDT